MSSTVVEFRGPWHHRAFRLIKAIVVGLLLGLCLAGFLAWAVVQLWPSNVPSGAVTAAFVIVILFFVMTIYWRDRYEPWRIILDEHGLWVGGRFSGRRVAYSDLRLIELEKPETSVGKVRQVVIERIKGSKISIWFSHNEAQQCFEALRAMCDHAPAVDEDSIYAPMNDSYNEEGLNVLIQDFTAKSRKAKWAAIGLALASVVLIVSLVMNQSRRGWIGAIALLLGGATSASASVQYRRNAQALMESRLIDDAVGEVD